MRNSAKKGVCKLAAYFKDAWLFYCSPDILVYDGKRGPMLIWRNGKREATNRALATCGMEMVGEEMLSQDGVAYAKCRRTRNGE